MKKFNITMDGDPEFQSTRGFYSYRWRIEGEINRMDWASRYIKLGRIDDTKKGSED